LPGFVRVVLFFGRKRPRKTDGRAAAEVECSIYRLRVTPWYGGEDMSTILIIILILLLVGALPSWPYSGGWGYYPSGGLGLVLLIVLILVLAGRI